ncbi:MAG: M67 family metallopeptidase [Gemmatimonadota bacterium]|nr:M67 family metallopeptidase [Gemmatimonadota bacterium]
MHLVSHEARGRWPESPRESTRLRLRVDLWGRVSRWARSGYPSEVCGILIGEQLPEEVVVTEVRQAANLEVERAADRYELDPQAFMEADRDARAAGLEIVGFWHSHPDSPAVPSETDRSRAWPGYAYLIVSVSGSVVAAMRAWRFDDGEFREEEMIS